MHVLDIVLLRQDDDSVKAPDDVRRKSYNAPTLEDKFDKSQMPKPMQVQGAFAWLICLRSFMIAVVRPLNGFDYLLRCGRKARPTSWFRCLLMMSLARNVQNH